MKMIMTTVFIGVIGLTLTTSGCAGDVAGTGASSTVNSRINSAAAESATAYPLDLTNCGSEVTFAGPPQRVVTLNQSAAEILIHLGLTDRIVGTGYELDAVPTAIADEYKSLPMLSGHGQEIKHEALLAAQPDFAYSSFASFFTPEQTGTRDELHALGIPTYLTEFDCSYHESVPDAGFELMFDEYRNLATIFDVPSRGEHLAAEQQAVVDGGIATAESIAGTPTVMWFYSTYGGTPWAAGPGGLPQHISDLVGVENIFADASTKWPEVSWDEVAARNPDVIILADLTRGEPGDTAQEKIDMLRSDPLTGRLAAVENNRFIVIPGSYMDPSYGSVYAVPELAEGILALQ